MLSVDETEPTAVTLPDKTRKVAIMALTFGILPIVAFIAFVFYIKDMPDYSSHRVVDGDIRSFSSALGMYRLNAGHYPSTGQGLMALVEKPADDPAPRRWVQVMSRIYSDPWGNPYVYRFPGRGNSEMPEIICAGPDGKAGTPDDLVHQVSK